MANKTINMSYHFKTVLLLAIVLNFATIKVFSQYQPMLRDNSKWLSYCYFEGSCNESNQIIGDSVVNDTIYKILYSNSPCTCLRPFAGNIELLREDSISKIVYLRDQFLAAGETEWYNFALNVGDTFHCINQNNNSIILDSITDTIINGFGSSYPPYISPLKVFYFHFDDIQFHTEPVIWIEGIGSLSGLNSPTIERYTWGFNGLLCHFDSLGNRDYHYSDGWPVDSCEGPYVGINELYNSNKIILYPNPANDKITIESTAINKDAKIFVYDVQGKLLTQQLLFMTKTDLDISHLAKGLYIVKFANADKIEMRIFLKE
jgi:hypothetical protein